jgi:hypothetical protein
MADVFTDLVNELAGTSVVDAPGGSAERAR